MFSTCLGESLVVAVSLPFLEDAELRLPGEVLEAPLPFQGVHGGGRRKEQERRITPTLTTGTSTRRKKERGMVPVVQPPGAGHEGDPEQHERPDDVDLGKCREHEGGSHRRAQEDQAELGA